MELNFTKTGAAAYYGSNEEGDEVQITKYARKRWELEINGAAIGVFDTADAAKAHAQEYVG